MHTNVLSVVIQYFYIMSGCNLLLVHGYGYKGTTAGIGNFTITDLQPHEVHLEWGFNTTADLSGFELVIRPLKAVHFYHHKFNRPSNFGKDSFNDGASKRKGIYQVGDLLPSTEYELFIYAIGNNGVIGSSEKIVFRTLAGSNTDTTVKVKPLEFLIVFCILVAWAVTFGMFVHKWGTIRIVQPGEYRPSNEPKNMDKIEIVKKPTDSVIYRNYSQKYTTTMQARDIREKKIERMHTMPNLKIAQQQEEMIAMEKISPISPDAPRGFRDTFLQDPAISSSKTTTTTLSQVKPATSTFGTFQIGVSKPKEDTNTSAGGKKLTGAVSTGYLDQLKTAAMLIVDLDNKNRSSSNQKVHNLQAPTQFHQDLAYVENETLHIQPLMRVEEEEEDIAPVVDINKSSPRYNSRKSLISNDNRAT